MANVPVRLKRISTQAEAAASSMVLREGQPIRVVENGRIYWGDETSALSELVAADKWTVQNDSNAFMAYRAELAKTHADGSTIASASTVNIGAAAGDQVTISGTTTITAFDTITVGALRRVTFSGILILTHNATSLILPTAANITTAAGDTALFQSLGSGNWKCVVYMRANGRALANPTPTELSLLIGTDVQAYRAELTKTHADGSTIASASTVNIGAAAGDQVTISGTTTITAFDTITAGALRRVTFSGILTLTHNATSLILPTAANITTSAGDTALFQSLGSGNWKCVIYMRASGKPLANPTPTELGLLIGTHVQAYRAELTKTHASGGTLASASTVNIGAASGDQIVISGTTTITDFDTVAIGTLRRLTFSGILTITHNATGMILPGSANITTAAGDTALFQSLGSGKWQCIAYERFSGKALNPPAAADLGLSIGTDVQAYRAELTKTHADGSTIASASTVNIGAAAGDQITISGTTTITAFDTITAGALRRVTFSGVLTLTHQGTSFILPTAANITTAAGDTALFQSLGSGNWKCVVYMRASGKPLANPTPTELSLLIGTDVQAYRAELTKTHADGSTIASASTVNIGAAAGDQVTISGTTTITAFDTITAGALRHLTFSGALILTHNATSLILPTGANITTAAGDSAIMQSLGSGNWKCIGYERADGNPLKMDLASPAVQGVLPKANGGMDASYYVNIAQYVLNLFATQVAATYYMGGAPGSAVNMTSGVAGTTSLAGLIYIAAADYPSVNGVAPKLRIRANLFTNATAPTGTISFGLHPITSPGSAGGAGVHSWTIGTVVAGSNGASQATPAANTGYALVGSDFPLPADGWYAVCVTTTSTIAANAMVQMFASLQLHYP